MKLRRTLALVAAATAASVMWAGAAYAGGGNSANAHACQKGGWEGLFRADGTPFEDQSDCVSYAAQGGAFGIARPKLGTLTPGTAQDTGQDRWSFTTTEANTTVTVTVDGDIFIDVEIDLLEDPSNTFTDITGFDGTETFTVLLPSPGTYTVRVEDSIGDPFERVGTYTITVTGDKPVSTPVQTLDEGPEEL
jgi:hypothetical protein